MLNLDHDDIDLMSFWRSHQNGWGYKKLFPSGGKHTKTATGLLACYASNLHTARTCRERGDITSAQVYEGICEQIYSKLPEFAKW